MISLGYTCVARARAHACVVPRMCARVCIHAPMDAACKKHGGAAARGSWAAACLQLAQSNHLCVARRLLAQYPHQSVDELVRARAIIEAPLRDLDQCGEARRL